MPFVAKKQWLSAFAVWLILAGVAIGNGAFREGLLVPAVGHDLGRALSSILLSVWIVLIAFVFVWRANLFRIRRDLLLIGAMWLVLTVLFEFGVGHYVMGNAWSVLLEDYNILRGRLWSLVLVAVFVGPLLCGWLGRKMAK